MDKSTRKGKAKKKEIIETFLHLMETTPIEEISVSDICETAGISIGGFYHYFNRKNDILISLNDILEKHLVNNVFPKLSKDDPVKSLQSFAHYLAIYVCEHDINYAKLFVTLTPEMFNLTKRPLKTLKKITELFRAGQDMGQIPNIPGPERMAELFLITIRGVIIDWAGGNGIYSLVNTMDELIRLLLTFQSAADIPPASAAE